MNRQFSRAVLPLAMLVWTGVVAYLWWIGFPDLPNDVSLANPNTQLVYEVGILNHCVFYALLALFGPMVLVMATKIAARARSGTPGVEGAMGRPKS